VSFTVTLPLPPPTNNLFVNVPGKGRVKSRRYKAWRRDAILSIFAQVPAPRRIAGAVAVSLCVPATMRGDLDNRLKAALDALVAANRIDDDRNVTAITIVRGGADAGRIVVQARAA